MKVDEVPTPSLRHELLNGGLLPIHLSQAEWSQSLIVTYQR
jgi:hypothetical protein